MDDWKIKMKCILYPCIGLMLALFVVYSSLRYELNIRMGTQIFPVELWDWVLPVVLGILVVYWGMGKRFELLGYSGMFQRGIKLFIGFVAGSILAIIQLQLVAESRTLNNVEHVADIQMPHPNACFRIAGFKLDSAGYGAAFNSYIEIGLRHRKNELVAEKFRVLPIVDKIGESGPFVYWLAMKDRITEKSIQASDAYRKYLYEKLTFQENQAYQKKRPPKFNYLEVIPNSKDYAAYIRAIQASKVKVAEQVVLLRPVYTPYKQGGEQYGWIALGIFAGLVLLLSGLMRSAPNLTIQQWRAYKNLQHPDEEEYQRRV